MTVYKAQSVSKKTKQGLGIFLLSKKKHKLPSQDVSLVMPFQE